MHRASKSELVFLRILVPAAMGIVCNRYVQVPGLSEWLWAVLTVLCLLLLLCNVFYRSLALYSRRWLPGLLVHLAVMVSFWLSAISADPMQEAAHFSRGRGDFLLIKIGSEPALTPRTIRFMAEVEGSVDGNSLKPGSGRLMVSVPRDSVFENTLCAGQYYLIPARYTEVEAPLNPYQFDYRAYLRTRGIGHQAYIELARLRPLTQLFPARDPLGELRRNMIARFGRFIGDRDAAAIASTLILGNKAAISPELLSAYTNTGTMHVLSVSGMHVALVFAMFSRLLGFLEGGRRRKMIQTVVIILIIWLYALLTGFSAAVLRAAMMISFVIAGKAMRRDSNGFNGLAASAVLLLFFNPSFLFDVGFQLSYLAVAGLLYYYPRIYRWLRFKNWLADKVWACMAVSLSAQLATFPLCLLYFNQFPLYFLLSNVFILIPASLILYAGLLFLLIPVNFLLEPLGYLLEKTVLFMNEGLMVIEGLPFSSLHGLQMPVWYISLLYAFIICFTAAFCYRKKPLVYASMLMLSVMACSYSLLSSAQVKRRSILLYSVRGKTAIGFFSGREAYLVSDLEQADKAFQYSIAPAVKARNLRLGASQRTGLPFSAKHLSSDGNLYKFAHTTLLLWDANLNGKKLSRPYAVDYLLLEDNARVRLSELAAGVRFKELIIGSRNSDISVSEWEKEARNLGLPYRVLKGRGAIELDLRAGP